MTLCKVAWRFFRFHKGLITAIVLFQLGEVLLGLWLPSLNAKIIDNGILAKNAEIIWRNGAIMLAVSFVQVLCMVGSIYTGSRTSMDFGRDLRARIFRKVQSFSPEDHHRFGAPTLITRTTNDVTQVQNVALMTFTVLITAPIMGVGGIIMALQEDTQLSLLLLVIVPILAAIIAAVMIALMPKYAIQQKSIDRINKLLREQLTGIRVIRAFTRQREQRAKFTAANNDLRAIWLKIGWLWAIFMPAASIVIGLSSAAVVWFAGFRIQSGSMEVGSLTAFISYLMMILGSVMMSGIMAMVFPEGEVSAKRLAEIESTIPSIQAPLKPRKLPNGALTFELRNASLKYEGAEEPVISGAHLRITPGSTTAVIGSTGSGKSSLIKLFPRLIDTTDGTVLAGGIDVRELDPHELRARIALVPQQAFLFSGTIASNIAGLPRASHKSESATIEHRSDPANTAHTIDIPRIEQALKAAQAWEFVSALDQGIDSPVESGGKNFSGGQRQRLTIARAIYRCLPPSSSPTARRQADLLIFDDSFSALDFATDAELRLHLREYIGDIAVIVIAQRISTIRNADEILVLAEGTIHARGNHAHLMESSPIYRDIVRSQLTEEEAK